MPERALLNDINPHVVSFYRWLKRGFRTLMPMKNDERLYYAHRERFNELLASGHSGSQKAAALFYYLNRTGYNGLCRFNRKGAFNVPFGRYAAISYRDDFREYRNAFRRWEFMSVDFEDMPLARGDLVYADPPYDVEFTSYAKEGFSWHDQVRAAGWLAKHDGPVILSNQATDRILDLYKSLGFELMILSAPRKISCTGDRTPAKEVLALKNF